MSFDLEALISRGEPALSFKWLVPEGGLPFGMKGNYVESISLPFPSFDVADPLFGGAAFYHYPGFMRLDSFSLVMYEDQQFSSTTWVTGWMYMIRDPKSGVYSLPSTYKKEIRAELVNDQNKVVTTIRLLGCWPTQVANLDLNYTDSSRLTLNITMSVDAVALEGP
jgi:hypothetical protein